jgi:integrase
MPKRVPPLNAKQLEKWRPDPLRVLEKADGAVPGLWVRLTPAGVMSWSLNMHVQGVRRRIALKGELTLKEARRKAEEARAAIDKGEDPTSERRNARARQKAAHAGVGTLGAVIAAYFENGPGAALRSAAAQRALIKVVFAKHIKLSALDVPPAELQLAVDQWPSKSSARHVAAYMRPVVRWAAKRGLMTKGEALEAPQGFGRPEQRVLTRDEAGQFLRALTSDPHDAAARFMLLTAARRDEVVRATWSEIKDGVWTIPAARRKDTRGPKARERAEDHVVPLSRQSLALLTEIARRQGGGRSSVDPAALTFEGARGARLTNWPRWSAGKEKRLGFGVTPHALRRTCATFAGDLGQPPHVVQALLGHRSIGGALHAGYNQSRYRAEVAEALQRVADLLDALRAGENNVVALRRPG